MEVATIYNEKGEYLGKIPHDAGHFVSKEEALASLLEFCNHYIDAGYKVKINGVCYNGNLPPSLTLYPLGWVLDA